MTQAMTAECQFNQFLKLVETNHRNLLKSTSLISLLQSTMSLKYGSSCRQSQTTRGTTIDCEIISAENIGGQKKNSVCRQSNAGSTGFTSKFLKVEVHLTLDTCLAMESNTGS